MSPDAGAAGFAAPEYGRASLSDVLPSALAALGVAGSPNPLGLPAGESIVVLLVDGLGEVLLSEHADLAPALAELPGPVLTTGFPSTTAASIASLGTGRPPGEHGLTGYTARLPGMSEPINWLRWHGAYSGRGLLEEYPPEQLQPWPTMFERAAAAGIAVANVCAPAYRDSGLTRAALRGADYRLGLTVADLSLAVAAAARARPSLVYCYLSELDLIGHVYGVRSEQWRLQLRLIGQAVELLRANLPDGTRLLVTGDHGMLDVDDAGKIDYDGRPGLGEGVDLIAGEARARYLHVAPGQADAVRTRWRDELGDQVSLVGRDEAIASGWFGPVVTPDARGRIGDLIVLPAPGRALVRRRAESRSSALIGHHGGLTDAERLVPLRWT